MQKLFIVTMQFLGDGSFETRKNGRRIAFNLAMAGKSDKRLDKLIVRYLSERDIKTFRDAIEKERQLVEETRHTAVHRRIKSDRGSQQSTLCTVLMGMSSSNGSKDEDFRFSGREDALFMMKRRHHHKSHKSSGPQSSQASAVELRELSRLCNMVNSGDWKERCHGMESLLSVVEENASMFSERDALHVFDAVIPRLGDANLKANIVAFKTMVSIVPLLQGHLNRVVSRIFQQCSNLLGSNNMQVRAVCSELFDTVLQHADPQSVLPALPYVVRTGSAKSKIAILEKLEPLLDTWYHSCAAHRKAIARHILPLVVSFSRAETSNMVCSQITKVLKVLSRLMGDRMWEATCIVHLSSDEISKLKSITLGRGGRGAGSIGGGGGGDMDGGVG